MLGVHWHGLAHWENIAADERSAATACAWHDVTIYVFG